MTRTELSTIGEFGLIGRLKNQFPTAQPTSTKGIGDDAAVIDNGGDDYLLLTTELLIEGIHFDLRYFPLKHLGYKAVVLGVSDIAAMNGLPTQITISVGLSNRFSIEAIDEFYEGIRLACEAYKLDLVGGDTTSSRGGLVVSVTAFGTVAKDKIVYRNTAKANDVLCLTGDIGAAYAGLQVLEREKQEFLANPNMQPQLSEKEYVVGKQLKPEARTDVIHELLEVGVRPTSMIDVSDGLASDLMHLCKESGVGAAIFEENIPVDEETYMVATELSISPLTMALNGGEDYELLFTISQADYEKVKNLANISFIGYMTDQPDAIELITKAKTKVPLKAQGWV